MKSAAEIFLTVGVPLVRSDMSMKGFRGFNEHDIATIQKEAYEQGKQDAVEAKNRAADADNQW